MERGGEGGSPAPPGGRGGGGGGGSHIHPAQQPVYQLHSSWSALIFVRSVNCNSAQQKMANQCPLSSMNDELSAYERETVRLNGETGYV